MTQSKKPAKSSKKSQKPSRAKGEVSAEKLDEVAGGFGIAPGPVPMPYPTLGLL